MNIFNEIVSKIKVTEESVLLSEVVKRINQVTIPLITLKIREAAILRWLAVTENVTFYYPNSFKSFSIADRGKENGIQKTFPITDEEDCLTFNQFAQEALIRNIPDFICRNEDLVNYWYGKTGISLNDELKKYEKSLNDKKNQITDQLAMKLMHLEQLEKYAMCWVNGQEREKIELSDTPIHLEEICKRINSQTNLKNKSLVKKFVANWLFEQGLLEKGSGVYTEVRIASEMGKQIGIYTEFYSVENGKTAVSVVKYNKRAQQFILNHLNLIINFKIQNSKKDMEEFQKEHASLWVFPEDIRFNNYEQLTLELV